MNKDIKKTILRAKLSVMALAAVVGLVSCEVEDNIVQEVENSIRLAPTVNTYTKYTGNEFVSGDEISLVITKYVDGQPTVIKPTGNFINNTRFTRGNSYFAGATAVNFPSDNAKIDLFAIYPYKAKWGTNMAKVPVSVEVDQTTNAILAQDLLVSTLSGQSPSVAPLPLVFNHVMTKLVVKANVSGNSNIEVNNIRFKLANTTTIDMTAKDAGVNKPKIAVVQTNSATKRVEFIPLLEKDSWSAIVVPQTIEGEVKFIEIGMTDGSIVPYSPNMEITSQSSLTLKEGTVNNVTITVTYKESTTISGTVTVNDWKTGETISGPPVEGAERTNFVGTSTDHTITKAIVTCKHNKDDKEQTTYTLPVYYTADGETKKMCFDFKGLANAPKTDKAVITQVSFYNGTTTIKVFTGAKMITLNKPPLEYQFSYKGTTLTWD